MFLIITPPADQKIGEGVSSIRKKVGRILNRTTSKSPSLSFIPGSIIRLILCSQNNYNRVELRRGGRKNLNVGFASNILYVVFKNNRTVVNIRGKTLHGK